MSALAQKADIVRQAAYIRFVPIRDLRHCGYDK
jgi:hypothetical protein